MLFKVDQPHGSAPGSAPAPLCLHSPSVKVLASTSHIRSQLAVHPGHQYYSTPMPRTWWRRLLSCAASATLTVLSARATPVPGSVPPPSVRLHFRRFGCPMSVISSASLSSVWLRPCFQASKSACEPYSSIGDSTIPLPAPLFPPVYKTTMTRPPYDSWVTLHVHHQLRPVPIGSLHFFIHPTTNPSKLRGPQPKAQSQSVAVYCGPYNRSFKQTIIEKSINVWKSPVESPKDEAS